MKQEKKSGYNAFKNLVENNREQQIQTPDTTKQKELHTQGEWKFNRHETGRYQGDIECELGKGENGIMNIRTIAIVLKNAGEEESQANAELIVKAVNERKALLDSNKELLETLKQLHGYTASKVKSYNIKDSTYFHVINMMANGLHNKIK